MTLSGEQKIGQHSDDCDRTDIVERSPVSLRHDTWGWRKFNIVITSIRIMINRMSPWPKYVCAILEDAEGRFLLESRLDDARLAAGRLTCFGGRREDDESPEECLRRELREELNWEPRTFKKC